TVSHGTIGGGMAFICTVGGILCFGGNAIYFRGGVVNAVTAPVVLAVGPGNVARSTHLCAKEVGAHTEQFSGAVHVTNAQQAPVAFEARESILVEPEFVVVVTTFSDVNKSLRLVKHL